MDRVLLGVGISLLNLLGRCPYHCLLLSRVPPRGNPNGGCSGTLIVGHNPFFGVGDATHVAMLFLQSRAPTGQDGCSPGPVPRLTLRLKTPNKRQRAAISPKLFFKLKVMASPGLPEIRTGQAVDHFFGIRNNLCVAYPH
jgi:hypothetical protein